MDTRESAARGEARQRLAGEGGAFGLGVERRAARAFPAAASPPRGTPRSPPGRRRRAIPAAPSRPGAAAGAPIPCAAACRAALRSSPGRRRRRAPRAGAGWAVFKISIPRRAASAAAAAATGPSTVEKGRRSPSEARRCAPRAQSSDRRQRLRRRAAIDAGSPAARPARCATAAPGRTAGAAARSRRDRSARRAWRRARRAASGRARPPAAAGRDEEIGLGEGVGFAGAGGKVAPGGLEARQVAAVDRLDERRGAVRRVRSQWDRSRLGRRDEIGVDARVDVRRGDRRNRPDRRRAPGRTLARPARPCAA